MTPISIVVEEVYNNILSKIESNELSSNKEIFEEVVLEAIGKVKDESSVSFDTIKEIVSGINGKGLFSALRVSSHY